MKFFKFTKMNRTNKSSLIFGLVTLCVLFYSCIKPINPVELQETITGGYSVMSRFQTSGFAQDVVVADTCAYIAQGQAGIAIINVKDPGNPKLLSELLNELPGYSKKLAYAKDSAGTEVIYAANGTPGVASINVTNKYHPTIPRSSNGFKPTISFFVINRILLTMISADGIWISDINDRKFVTPRYNIQVPGYAMAVCVSSDSTYALLAVGEGGMAMMNFTHFDKGRKLPSDSTEVPHFFSGRLDLPGTSIGIANIPGLKYACVACGPSGLQIVDYADTSNIKIVSEVLPGGFTKDVCISGNRAYLAVENKGVVIIDISIVTSPKIISTITVPDVNGIDVNNGYVYAAADQDGLITIKIP